VVVTLSGGNIDPLVLTRVLQHGLAVAERYLRFVVRVPDEPGTLATLLRRIAEQDVNVLEIEHRRSHEQLRLNEAAVSLTVEARGPEHAAAVLAALREAGYGVVRE
jgi:threonine dehydratase